MLEPRISVTVLSSRGAGFTDRSRLMLAPNPFAGARGQSAAARPFIRELRTNDELRLLALLGRPDQLSGRLNRLTRSRRTPQ